MRAVGALLVLGVVLAACSAETTPATTAQPKPTVSDAAGRKACSDYAKLGEDVRAGVVTPDELRPRAQTIYDSGRLSEHPGIAQHSAAFLRGTTENDTAIIGAAMDGLSADCNPR